MKRQIITYISLFSLTLPAMVKAEESTLDLAEFKKLFPVKEKVEGFKQFNGKISFALPQKWKIQHQLNKEARAAAQILIPCQGLEKTPLSANASVSSFTNPHKVSVKDFGDYKMKNNYEGFVIIEDYHEGQNWRTVYSRVNDEGIPYVMIDRFGVSQEYLVHSRIAFPLVKQTIGDWLATTIQEINTFIGSIKIDNKTEFKHQLVIEHNQLFLK